MQILAATDGSMEATQAGAWLAKFPMPADADVIVISAVAAPTLPLGATAISTIGHVVRAHAERSIADMCAHLRTRWPRVTGRVIEGDPREAIPDVAGATGSDLIVVGSRGLGVVKSALLGSVSLAVARHAPCSVLVCRGDPRPIRHVTVGLDGSQPAREALRFFECLPLGVGITIQLVAVIEPMPFPVTSPEMALDGATLARAMEGYESAQRAALGRSLTIVAAELRETYGNVEVAFPVGSPGLTLTEQAAEAGSDLIIVGARGLGALKRLVLGSVSESVLRHALCPVLIARPLRFLARDQH